ncbi:MAG: polysaccharide biosynthesis protein [Firmicutes bacterium ML8_F2]|nr:MAG: polysaccharide biosynthesis protein [Firmicutes bacterium ML8_F2]
MKQTIKKLLPTNRFARSVSILAGGTAAGQAIVVLASPLLTRLYSPEDFGLLAVFASMLGIIGVVASLRYQLAIPLPESDQEAAHVVVLSLLVVLGITMLTTIGVIFFGESIAQIANTPALGGYLWLLPLGLLLMGIYQIFNYWAIRNEAFTVIARTKLTQSLSMVAVQIFGYALGPVALLIGRISGQAAGATSLGALAVRKRWSTFRQVKLCGVRWAAARYKRFPIYSSWGGAFNTAGRELPPLLFAALFSASAAGIYMLAHRVLNMPMTLIGRSIADVFFFHAAEANRNGQLAQLVANIHEKLAHIAMPPALLLVIAGPELFALVFGERWQQAGIFVQCMAPWIYMQFITSPLSRVNSVLEKQAQGMFFQTILFLTRIGALFIGAYYQELLLAVALFGMVSALCFVGLLVWIIYVTGNTWCEFINPTAKAFSWGVILVTPLIIAQLSSATFIIWLMCIVTSLVLITARYINLFKKAW